MKGWAIFYRRKQREQRGISYLRFEIKIFIATDPPHLISARQVNTDEHRYFRKWCVLLADRASVGSWVIFPFRAFMG